MRKIVCYKRNGRFVSLKDKDNYSDIQPVFADASHGKYILQHSLILVVKNIIENTFDNAKLVVEHTINGGLYCEVHSNVLLSENDVILINDKLQEIINEDDPFITKYKTIEELKEIFQDNEEKITILNESELDGAYYCEFNGIKDFFHTPTVDSTKTLEDAFIKYYPPGIIIYSNKKHVKEDQKKLFNIYLESEKWAKILNWEKVNFLNRSIENKKDINHLIHVAEALHEKKIVDIANYIDSKRGKVKLITIAGPSSSGKTTFLKRLSVQLRVLGISVMGISLDNYFVNRDKTPIDEEGKPDFESIKAIDIELFNDNLHDLIDLKEVELPIFDFQTGMRKKHGIKTKIDKNTIIIIEGIHGLNEELTKKIDRENKIKIYISALTQINIDNTHRISTTDNRLIRRIVRDFLYRNHNVDQTFAMWPGVRKGEEKNIFPYQEESDFMFNSSLLYEFSVLKSFVEPMLKEVTEDKPYYLDAQRLLFTLSFFKPIPIDIIPRTSVIREFIGGSSFNY